ncbi:hypothetical protein [Cupriavidus sp. TMH.W2]|uniref:hypothetical protein n=1 Tax=Cupriavidus sp. TMH.W2 TaxID=3434465 RepID=UPI003D76B6B9
MTPIPDHAESSLTERIDAARASGVVLDDQDVQRMQELASQRTAVLGRIRHPGSP